MGVVPTPKNSGPPFLGLPNNPESLLAVNLPGFVAFRCFKTGENAGGFLFPQKSGLFERYPIPGSSKCVKLRPFGRFCG